MSGYYVRVRKSGIKSHQIVFLLTVLVIFMPSLLIQTTLCQEKVRFEVQGFVVEEGTNKSLPYVNVFLANTTLGTATDSLGRFVIKRIPVGDYQLVARMIGFKTVTKWISATTGSQNHFVMHLPLQPIVTPTVVVTAAEDKRWQRLYKLMKPYILGTSKNAMSCIIDRPWVLDIKKDAVKDIITVNTTEPLIIENRALGYMVEVEIERFVVENKSLVDYLVYTRFFPMEGSASEQSDWEIKRDEAYRGSPNHFFSSLLGNRLKEEGFTFRKLMFSPYSNMGFNSRLVDVESLITSSMDDHLKIISLPEWTKVNYDRNNESRDYRNINERSGLEIEGATFQISYLQSLMNYIPVQKNGSIPHGSLVYHGCWAFDRLGDMVPADYQMIPNADISVEKKADGEAR